MLVVVGIAGLVLGGRFTVDGAVEIATAMGISRAVVGLTIVALGTSLPELVASVIAVRRDEADLAVGNVVGSNIFNLLFVLGVTATVHPVPVPDGGFPDLVAATVAGALVLACSIGSRGITRLEGALLLASYAGYLSWRAASAVAGSG